MSGIWHRKVAIKAYVKLPAITEQRILKNTWKDERYTLYDCKLSILFYKVTYSWEEDFVTEISINSFLLTQVLSYYQGLFPKPYTDKAKRDKDIERN